MLRFEWNALQVGDPVAVHDPSDPEFALRAGTVAMVETKRSKRGENGVGIRVETGGGHRVLWPSFPTAHLDPSHPKGNCWLCAAAVEAALPRLPAPRLAVTATVR
jgi:hypothetical protein